MPLRNWLSGFHKTLTNSRTRRRPNRLKSADVSAHTMELLENRQLMTADLGLHANVGSGGDHRFNIVELTPGASAEQTGGETALGYVGFSQGMDTHPESGLVYSGRSKLYELNPQTDELREVGRLQDAAGQRVSIRSFTFSPDGILYGLGSNDKRLYTIDTPSALVTRVGTLQEDSIYETTWAIEFGPDGTLYAAGFSLMTVDLSTLESSAPSNGDTTFPVSPISWMTNYVTELDFSSDGQLLAISAYGSQQGKIFAIDTDTGEQTLFGTYSSTLTGLASTGAAGPVTPQPNSAPVGTADSYELTVNSFFAGNVLSNDIDADRDALTASLSSDVRHGSLVLREDGSFRYTPASDFSGDDSFRYVVSDGQQSSREVVVSLTITASSADDDRFEDNDSRADAYNLGILQGRSEQSGLLIKSRDDDWYEFQVAESGPTTITIEFEHGRGRDLDMRLFREGSNFPLRFGYSASDNESFHLNLESGETYHLKVFGWAGGENNYSLVIEAPEPAVAPTGVADTYTVNEDGFLELLSSDGVLANDLNLTSAARAQLVEGKGPSHARSFQLNADGSLEYRPQSDFHGTDQFTYVVVDSIGNSSEVTAEITIQSVNDAPSDLTLSDTTIDENAAAGTSVGRFSTTDPDHDLTFVYKLVSGSGDTDNSAFRISGDRLVTRRSFDFETKRTYRVRVRTTDSGGQSLERRFTINVRNQNESPVITTPSNLGRLRGAQRFTVPLSGSDPEGGTLTWSASSSDVNVRVQGNRLEITGGNFGQSSRIRVTARDEHGATTNRTLRIRFDHAPTVTGPTTSTATQQRVTAVTEGTLAAAIQTAVQNSPMAQTGLTNHLQATLNAPQAVVDFKKEVEFTHNWGNKIDTRLAGKKNHGNWERLRADPMVLSNVSLEAVEANANSNLFRIRGSLTSRLTWDKQQWSFGALLGSISETGYVRIDFAVDVRVTYQVETSTTSRVTIGVTAAVEGANATAQIRNFSDPVQIWHRANLPFDQTLVGVRTFANSKATESIRSTFADEIEGIAASADMFFSHSRNRFEAHVLVTKGEGEQQEVLVDNTAELPGVFANDADRVTDINPAGYTGQIVHYVNGMLTPHVAAVQEATLLSHQLRRPVRLIYNGTSGIGDLSEILADYTWNATQAQHNPTTERLALLLKSHARSGDDFAIVTHSQGNMIMWNALQSVRASGLGGALENRLRWVSTGSPIAVEGVRGHTNFLNEGDPIGQLTGPVSQLNSGDHFFASYVGQISAAHVDNIFRHPAIFDADFYLLTNRDLERAFGRTNHEAALNHWLTHGIREGRRASIAFDARYYLNNHADLVQHFGASGFERAVQHWFQYGMAEGRRSSGEFDVSYYLSQHQDLVNAFGANGYALAVDHFVSHGISEGRQTVADFSIDGYYNRYEDLQRAVGKEYYNLYIHWIRHGQAEGRKAGPVRYSETVSREELLTHASVFDPEFYLLMHRDLERAFGRGNFEAARDHWLRHGISEGRRGSAVFDVRYYRDTNPDLLNHYAGNDFEGLIRHWLDHGIDEGRASSREFNAQYYLSQHGDLQRAFGATNHRSAVQHFVDHGMTEGRATNTGFNIRSYHDRYSDLQRVIGRNYRALWIHWLRHGVHEGRDPS